MVSIQRTSYTPLLDPPPNPQLAQQQQTARNNSNSNSINATNDKKAQENGAGYNTAAITTRNELSQIQREALDAMKNIIEEQQMDIEQIENETIKKDLRNWRGEAAMVK